MNNQAAERANIGSSFCNVYVTDVINRGPLTDAVFDFEDERDFFAFCSSNNISPENYRGSCNFYIWIKNLPSSLRLEPEEYYKLNLSVLSSHEKYEISAVEGNSAFFRQISVIIRDSQDEDSHAEQIEQLFKAFSKEEKAMRRHNFRLVPQGNIEGIAFPNTKDIKVAARYVSEGNWNEVYMNNHLEILYDAGYSIYAEDKEVRDFLDKRRIDSSSHDLLCLSHWDKDHCRSLSQMTDKEVNSFNNIVAPDIIPSFSSACLFAKLSDRTFYHGNLIIISTARLTRRCTGDVRLILKDVVVSIFVGQGIPKNWASGSAPNSHCIFMHVHGEKKVAYLTGDSFYLQLRNSILLVNPLLNESILVVPHHGAKADSESMIESLSTGSIAQNEWLQHTYPVFSTDFYYRHPHCKAVELLVKHSGANESYFLSHGNDYEDQL